MDYLLHHPKLDVNVAEFDAAAGVGVTVTPDQIEDVVSLSINTLQVYF